MHVHTTNTSNLPVEALEIEYPLTLLRYELVDGSGGAGKYRGGMGLRRVYRADADCRLRVDGSRLHRAPWGLLGGAARRPWRVRLRAGRRPSSRARPSCAPAQWFEVITPGRRRLRPARERDRDAVRARSGGRASSTPKQHATSMDYKT